MLKVYCQNESVVFPDIESWFQSWASIPLLSEAQETELRTVRCWVGSFKSYDISFWLECLQWIGQLPQRKQFDTRRRYFSWIPQFASSQVSIGQKVCEMQNDGKNVKNFCHLETHHGVWEDVKRLMGSATWGWLGDTWVAPPGGYLRYLGPSPLTAVQGVLNFFRHPFLICSSCLRMYKHFSWTATALSHQNLFCQQRWKFSKGF